MDGKINNMALGLSVDEGGWVHILAEGKHIEIHVAKIKSKQVRLNFFAPEEVRIIRDKVLDNERNRQKLLKGES